MNVVDALYVTFGLDPTQFKKGQKDVDASLKKLREAGDKTAKDLSEQGKRASEFFRVTKVELLGLLAVFGAATGLKDFISSSITGQAALGRLSTNLDMSANRLQAWSTVAQEVGAQGEDALNALQTVAQGLAEAAVKGHSAFTDTARANGIALTDAQGHALDYEHVLLNVSARLKELPRQQALWLSGQLGVGGMFNTLMLGPAELEKRLNAAQRLTGMTKKSIAQAQQLQMQWADLKARFQGVSDTLFARLEPVLIRLGNQLADFIDHIDWKKVGAEIDKWVGYANSFLSALGGIKGVLIEIAAIKAFSFMAGIAGNILQLMNLTRALRGVQTAASAAAAAETAAAAGGGAATAGLGLASKVPLLGIAAAIGGAIGTAIWHGIQGTKVGDAVGATVYRMGTLLGFNDGSAAEAPPVNHSGDFHGLPKARPSSSKTRPDDNLDLFGGKYSAPVSGKQTQLFNGLEAKYGLPAGLLDRIYATESSRGKHLVSSAGALGPFQFEPGTARDYGLNAQTVFDTGKSADAAARYLRDLLAMFHGDLPKAVAAYNWGQGNVQRNGLTGLPLETQEYLRKVLGDTTLGAYKSADRGDTASTTTVQTHIGEINVHTRATDAKGIARDLRTDLQNNALIGQADTGLA